MRFIKIQSYFAISVSIFAPFVMYKKCINDIFFQIYHFIEIWRSYKSGWCRFTLQERAQYKARYEVLRSVAGVQMQRWRRGLKERDGEGNVKTMKHFHAKPIATRSVFNTKIEVTLSIPEKDTPRKYNLFKTFLRWVRKSQFDKLRR